eukprot:UN03835
MKSSSSTTANRTSTSTRVPTARFDMYLVYRENTTKPPTTPLTPPQYDHHDYLVCTLMPVDGSKILQANRGISLGRRRKMKKNLFEFLFFFHSCLLPSHILVKPPFFSLNSVCTML